MASAPSLGSSLETIKLNSVELDKHGRCMFTRRLRPTHQLKHSLKNNSHWVNCNFSRFIFNLAAFSILFFSPNNCYSNQDQKSKQFLDSLSTNERKYLEVFFLIILSTMTFLILCLVKNLCHLEGSAQRMIKFSK